MIEQCDIVRMSVDNHLEDFGSLGDGLRHLNQPLQVTPECPELPLLDASPLGIIHASVAQVEIWLADPVPEQRQRFVEVLDESDEVHLSFDHLDLRLGTAAVRGKDGAISRHSVREEFDEAFFDFTVRFGSPLAVPDVDTANEEKCRDEPLPGIAQECVEADLGKVHLQIGMGSHGVTGDADDTRIDEHRALQLRRRDRRLVLDQPRIEMLRREIPPQKSGQRRSGRFENMHIGKQVLFTQFH